MPAARTNKTTFDLHYTSFSSHFTSGPLNHNTTATTSMDSVGLEFLEGFRAESWKPGMTLLLDPWSLSSREEGGVQSKVQVCCFYKAGGQYPCH